MSVLKSTDDGWLISHQNYINKIYTCVNNNDKNIKLFFNDKLFKLNSQYLRENQIIKSSEGVLNLKDSKARKRKKISTSLSSKEFEEVKFIQDKFEKIISSDMKNEFFSYSEIIDNNKTAREASNNFYLYTYDEPKNFNGSNNTDFAVINKVNNVDYVFPKRCNFFSYDVRQISDKIDLNNQFDFILMDPPWWNKSVRRKKINNIVASYQMMYNEELVGIPINKLLKSNGILGIWCTNAKSHLNHIFDVMFPAWGIKHIATWYWIKVTQSGNTICNFNYNSGKQPFELLIFGIRIENDSTKFPNKKLLVSVPSSVHSHKPPLTELLQSYLPGNSDCLEIFARYLLPGWTSWGLEVLKFQHLSLYNAQNSNID